MKIVWERSAEETAALRPLIYKLAQWNLFFFLTHKLQNSDLPDSKLLLFVQGKVYFLSKCLTLVLARNTFQSKINQFSHWMCRPCYRFLPNIPSGTLPDNTLDTVALLLPSDFSNQQLFNYVPLVGGCRQCRRPPGAFSPAPSLPSVSRAPPRPPAAAQRL